MAVVFTFRRCWFEGVLATNRAAYNRLTWLVPKEKMRSWHARRLPLKISDLAVVWVPWIWFARMVYPGVPVDCRKRWVRNQWMLSVHQGNWVVLWHTSCWHEKKMNRTKLYKLVNQLVNYETYSLLNRPCVMLVPCTTHDVIGRQPLINQNGRRKTHRKGKVDWKIQCKPCCTTNPFVSNIYIQYLRGFRRNMYTENKTLSWILSLHTYHFISYSLLIEYLRDCAMRLILCVHLTQCDCAMR